MDWLQNPLDIAELSSSCPCQGAKCRGRCSAYGVCPVYTSSDTCRGMMIVLSMYFLPMNAYNFLS